jgi:hypothetical protein
MAPRGGEHLHRVNTHTTQLSRRIINLAIKTVLQTLVHTLVSHAEPDRPSLRGRPVKPRGI